MTYKKQKCFWIIHIGDDIASIWEKRENKSNYKFIKYEVKEECFSTHTSIEVSPKIMRKLLYNSDCQFNALEHLTIAFFGYLTTS